MKLEKVKPEDAKECTSWMMENIRLNGCAPRHLKGCTFFKIAGILYLPVKPVLLMESLAPNPAITGKKRLLAIRRAMDELRKIHPGVELCFLTKNDNKLDEAARFYGFEEAKGYVLFRLLDAAEARKREKTRKEVLAEARLRHNARVLRADGAQAAGSVCDLSGTARGETARAGS